MVFSNLSPSEKVAFFGLLDEYFASRPDVFGHIAGSSDGHGAESNNSSSNAVHAAAKNAAASALQHTFTGQSTASSNDANSGVPAWKRELLNARNSASSQAANAEHESPSVGVGRVASAAASFRSSPATSPSPPSTTNKLVSQKKFGDVDTTSAKGMYSSIRHGTANKSAVPPPVAPPIPPAFATPKNNFAPPPVRRVSSSTVEPVRATPPPPPPPPRVVEPEPEEPGEWAEALYDYSSEDPGDLQLQEGQRVYVVEKTSDDWWTAIHEGKRGLVPASYVKVL